MEFEHFVGREVPKHGRMDVADISREARTGAIVVRAGLEEIGGLTMRPKSWSA